MTTYIIFTRTTINQNKSYPQNARRGEKAHYVTGRQAMIAKVFELIASGEKVLSVRTELGNFVNI